MAVAVTVVLGVTGLAGAAVAVDPPPPPTPNEHYAIQLYGDFLGRPPTTDEEQGLANALDAGQLTRDQAGVGASRSYAYAQQLVIGFYQNTLGRDPDINGLAYWTGQIWAGKQSVAQVAAAIYASNEWYQAVGGTDEAWVHNLYVRILHRSPDTSGEGYWASRTVSDGRLVVALVFYQSNESLRTRTDALYTSLLRRAPDDAGLAYWTQVMLDRGDRDVAGLLAGSNEYFQYAQGSTVQ